MNVNDLIVSEMARMKAYKGLSACYTLPLTGIVTRLKKLERQLAFLSSDAYTPAVLMRNELENTENLEKLKVEFARLFIGPYRLAAPPYGSIYLDEERKIMGDSTIDVRRRYIESGLSLAGHVQGRPGPYRR